MNETIKEFINTYGKAIDKKIETMFDTVGIQTRLPNGRMMEVGKIKAEMKRIGFDVKVTEKKELSKSITTITSTLHNEIVEQYEIIMEYKNNEIKVSSAKIV